MTPQQKNEVILKKEYEPKIFDELFDFSLSREQLKVHNKSLQYLGTLISKYRMHDIVGINLLHKHFNLSSEEMIVRTFETPKKAIMKPLCREKFSSAIFPYLWKCVVTEFGIAWYPLEFIYIEKESCPELDILSYADAFLIELGEELIKNNLQNIFGISGLYSRTLFSVSNEETIVETTDEVNRVLTLSSKKKVSVDPHNSTKTLWVFPA